VVVINHLCGWRGILRHYPARVLPVKLLIAGGGTGGHVFPALGDCPGVAGKRKQREVVLVGTERGIEMKLVPQAGCRWRRCAWPA